MRKIIIVLCIVLVLLVLNACTKDHSVPVTVSPAEEIEQSVEENQEPIRENQKPVEEYGYIAYADFPSIEIKGEKLGFLGKSYEEISPRLLYEKLMYKAVSFYMAAYIDNLESMKELASIELLSEIGKTLSGVTKEDSYKYGGDKVVSLKKLSTDNKPYFIAAPQQMEENKYIVEMTDLDKNNLFKVTFSIDSSEEIKVIEFNVEKAN